MHLKRRLGRHSSVCIAKRLNLGVPTRRVSGKKHTYIKSSANTTGITRIKDCKFIETLNFSAIFLSFCDTSHTVSMTEIYLNPG